MAAIPALRVPGRSTSSVPAAIRSRLPALLLLAGFILAWHVAVVNQGVSSMEIEG